MLRDIVDVWMLAVSGAALQNPKKARCVDTEMTRQDPIDY